jgi:SWI/SNF-related matrix-associated actin-dependent regulator of chromatin subfamily B protein 1
MPSPIPPPSSSFPDALPRSPSLENGGSASALEFGGAVPEGLLDDTAGATDLPLGSMNQSKQKAKAVLAASGALMKSSSPEEEALLDTEHHNAVQSPKLLSPSKTNGATPLSNGASITRKRSRSGSRIESRTSSNASNLSNPLTDLPSLPTRPRPSTHDLHLNQYVTRDLLHSAALASQTEAHKKLIVHKREQIEHYEMLRRERQTNPAALYGEGYGGYGNGRTEGPPNILYPLQRKRPGSRKTRSLRVPRKEMATQAEQMEELIPVRLDLDWGNVKLRDSFTWNLHDRVIPPDLFAEQLVEDFGLPPEASGPLVHSVSQSIVDQIQDFYPHVFIEEDALDPELPYYAYKNDEMRVLIKLNITIGQHTLVDQFEWELNNPLNSPEEFATSTSRDLSLSGEFTTAIAHSIREQTQLFTRSLYITEHPFDGRPIEDSDLNAALLPSPLPSVFRPSHHAKDYTPFLYESNEAEIDRAETSLSREQRRQKRSVSRRGGPALPDLKERPRIVRTLVVSSVLPGAAKTIEDSRLYKRSTLTGRSSKRGPGQRIGDDDSEESESEESSVESPAMPMDIRSGTARTRNLRGAAATAAANVRATYNRSATPETAYTSLHHHETRTSARRFGGREVREESDDPTTFMLRLKLKREPYRQWWRDYKAVAKLREAQAAEAQAQAQRVAAVAARPPQQGTPNRNPMGPPSSTPGIPQQQTPSSQGHGSSNGIAPQPIQQFGVVEVQQAPQPGQPTVCIEFF